jgi:phospholipase/carboxylesterase
MNMTGETNQVHSGNVGPDPHQGSPVIAIGEPLSRASYAMLLLHGRGASAEDILSLASAYFLEPGFAFLAPQAANHTWYPNRFLEPIEVNEPWLTSALNLIHGLLDRISAAGILPERTLLLGFSQGACLTLEYAARHARRYGGIAGLSGALIGPDGTSRDYLGHFDGTPLFLGCSDVDIHVPKERVIQSAQVLQALGGHVTQRLYAGMGHTVNQDEIDFVRAMMRSVALTTT